MRRLLVFAVMLTIVAGGLWFMISRSGDGPAPRPSALLRGADDGSAALLRRAHRLWRSEQFDDRDTLDALEELAGRLDDAGWRAASAPVFAAWDRLRGIPAAKARLAVVNAKLLPRFVRAGGLEEVAGLVRAADRREHDAGAIDEALAFESSRPLSTWPGSRAELIVAASLHAGGAGRARGYLARLTWTPEAGADAKQGTEPAREVVELCARGQEGHVDPVSLVRAWTQWPEQPLGPACLQPALEDVVLARFDDARPSAARPEVLLLASADQPGGEAFWARILFRLPPRMVRAGERAIADATSLVDAFGSRFVRSEACFAFWARSGELTWRWAGDDARRVAGFYRRALDRAASDALRARAARDLAFHLERAGDPGGAVRAVEGALAVVEDKPLRLELQALVKQMLRRQAPGAPPEAPAVSPPDLVDRLASLLERARRENRPEEEIRTLEESIRRLRSQPGK